MMTIDISELKEAKPGSAWKHPRMGGYFCVLSRNEETGVTLFAFQPRKGNAYTFTIEADGEVKGWGLQEFTARQLFENPPDAILGSEQLALTGKLLGFLLSKEGWLRGTVLDFDAARTGDTDW